MDITKTHQIADHDGIDTLRHRDADHQVFSVGGLDGRGGSASAPRMVNASQLREPRPPQISFRASYVGEKSISTEISSEILMIPGWSKNWLGVSWGSPGGPLGSPGGPLGG